MIFQREVTFDNSKRFETLTRFAIILRTRFRSALIKWRNSRKSFSLWERLWEEIVLPLCKRINHRESSLIMKIFPRKVRPFKKTFCPFMKTEKIFRFSSRALLFRITMSQKHQAVKTGFFLSYRSIQSFKKSLKMRSLLSFQSIQSRPRENLFQPSETQIKRYRYGLLLSSFWARIWPSNPCLSTSTSPSLSYRQHWDS